MSEFQSIVWIETPHGGEAERGGGAKQGGGYSVSQTGGCKDRVDLRSQPSAARDPTALQRDVRRCLCELCGAADFSLPAPDPSMSALASSGNSSHGSDQLPGSLVPSLFLQDAA